MPPILRLTRHTGCIGTNRMQSFTQIGAPKMQEKDGKIRKTDKIIRLADIQTVIQTSRRLDSVLHEAAQKFELLSNIQDQK